MNADQRNVLVILKPKFGDPCNRCGECCRLSLCGLGEMVFGEQSAPCPALEVEEAHFGCGLLRRPAHYMELNWGTESERDNLRQQFSLVPMSAYLAIGKGCGCPDEPSGKPFG